MAKGILLDENNDLKIQVRRGADGKITSGLVVGESKVQDVYLVLQSNQGEFKEDPILGANLFRNIRMKADRSKIKSDIEIALARMGVKLSDVEKELQAFINQQNLEL
ncbi:MAG: hypothetical protein LBN27_05880 [Prevotellaceae bacterium]|jgi:hypothetical protein|nr:hypothetical protein [Prevotellaceae bacterium]